MARADLAARRLLDHFEPDQLPVDPYALAEHLDVIVVEQPMAADVSGMLIREPDRTVIGVNQGHHKHRKRFTVAHELGHHQLHRGRSLIMDTDVRVNFRDPVSSLATDREEIEANRFAASLLMPEHLVRREISQTPFDSAVHLVTRLAGQLAVSPEAMNFRLVNLGVIPTPVEL